MATTNSDESSLVENTTNPIFPGNMTVKGNLSVEGQTTTNGLKVVDDDDAIAMWVTDDGLSFRKACCFTDGAEFNNGKTIIGMETTYNSAYIGSETIQAGERLVLGDSAAKWDVDSRTIIADTFTMTLNKLASDSVTMKRGVANVIEASSIQVTKELIGQTIFADTVKTNNLYM